MNKRIFTEEEKEYIINNWGKESANSMKKRFNCSWYAVCNVAKEANLEMPKSNLWTKEEIEKLRELSTKMHYKKIAKILDKTENAVYLKARKLNIKIITDNISWTSEEELFLKNNWGNMKLETLAKNLNRTEISLKVKAIRMHLGTMAKNNMEYLFVSDMIEILSVSRDRITTTWVKLGLNLKRKKFTDNKSYYVVTLEDLVEFLKNNQDIWDSRKVELYILGEEYDWLKEKRIRDSKEGIKEYRIWTDEEIARAEMYIKMGKTYEEIASELDRSEWSVAHLLNNMGYIYSLPQYWKGHEIKYLREHYKTQTYEEIGKYLGRTKKAVSVKACELGFKKKLVKKR